MNYLCLNNKITNKFNLDFDSYFHAIILFDIEKINTLKLYN